MQSIAFRAALLLVGCNLKRTPEALPILGNSEIVNGDTIYHQVRDFSFINQDSQEVNNATFEGKAYVVDFFFISCPTICPMVNKQMLRVYDRFKDDDRLLLLAHTIDTKHDTIPRLKQFAQNLGVSNDKWIFVTGVKDSIYSIANDYFSIAIEDPEAPGGFDHSGRLILVDKNRHVRSFCDGTDPESVDRFMKDIEVLLKEM
ncbi:MAG: SCO family protein [Haliscomenobacter sp.]|nr:SCO family protein [Haliscomenobacter sp.]